MKTAVKDSTSSINMSSNRRNMSFVNNSTINGLVFNFTGQNGNANNGLESKTFIKVIYGGCFF